jgi:hypothetical protein
MSVAFPSAPLFAQKLARDSGKDSSKKKESLLGPLLSITKSARVLYDSPSTVANALAGSENAD